MAKKKSYIRNVIETTEASMRLLIISILLNFLSIIAYSQNSNEVDSMISIIDTLPIQEKIRTLESITKYYCRANPKIAVKYALQAYDIATSNSLDTITIANSLHLAGTAFWFSKETPSALDFLLRSLKLRRQTNDKKGVSKSLNNIAIIYLRSERLQDALEMYNQSLEIKKELNDTLGIAATYSNIGNVYIKLSEPETALEYSLKASEIWENAEDKTGLSLCYNNIAIVFTIQKHYNKALEYLFNAHAIAIKTDNKIELLEFKINIADI